ncbi:MAG: oligoendopeptidase F, partial [Halobacteriales archaeon]|nr:oligoendopeptidase F [Halobacteriales archaeon]
MSTVPEREEIPEQYTWDLETIFATDEDWEEAFEDVQRRLADLESMADRVTDDGPSLLATLELRDAIGRDAEQVVAYARMRSHEDTRDQEYQALAARARALASEAQSAASFIEPAIQAEDRERIESMIDETDGLEEYDHELEDILRLKPHTRSAEVEELLAELGEVLGAPHDVYSMLTDADMTYPTVEHPDGDTVQLTQSNFTRLLKHEDRAFRQEVHESFYDELETVRNTIGATLKNSIKADVKLARAREYETAREAALDGPNVP